jgi:hypothetical protein
VINSRDWQTATFFAAALAALGLLLTEKSFEDQFANSEVLRDNTATIVATGAGRARIW